MLPVIEYFAVSSRFVFSFIMSDCIIAPPGGHLVLSPCQPHVQVQKEINDVIIFAALVSLL